jgi:hypothetical protein
MEARQDVIPRRIAIIVAIALVLAGIGKGICAMIHPRGRSTTQDGATSEHLRQDDRGP